MIMLPFEDPYVDTTAADCTAAVVSTATFETLTENW
jgi:hypothetical protein